MPDSTPQSASEPVEPSLPDGNFGDGEDELTIEEVTTPAAVTLTPGIRPYARCHIDNESDSHWYVYSCYIMF